MMSPKAISLCCAALIAGCGNVESDLDGSFAPKTLNAKSVVTLERSQLAMEQDMTADQKIEFGRAVNAIILLPESGSCAEADILAHAVKFKDAAFSQSLKFTRLHGLTAQQILTLGKDRACQPQIKSTPTVSATFNNYAEVESKDSILIRAPSYLNAQLESREATLKIFCNTQNETHPDLLLSADVIDIPKTSPSDSEIIFGQIYGFFFQRGDIYFDDVLTKFPSIYEKIVRDIDRPNGTTERRSERILVGPTPAINDVFLPNVKIAKTMRLEYQRGIGPTFDLTGVKDKIEALEKECTSKDAKK